MLQGDLTLNINGRTDRIIPHDEVDKLGNISNPSLYNNILDICCNESDEPTVAYIFSSLLSGKPLIFNPTNITTILDIIIKYKLSPNFSNENLENVFSSKWCSDQIVLKFVEVSVLANDSVRVKELLREKLAASGLDFRKHVQSTNPVVQQFFIEAFGDTDQTFTDVDHRSNGDTVIRKTNIKTVRMAINDTQESSLLLKIISPKQRVKTRYSKYTLNLTLPIVEDVKLLAGENSEG